MGDLFDLHFGSGTDLLQHYACIGLSVAFDVLVYGRLHAVAPHPVKTLAQTSCALRPTPRKMNNCTDNNILNLRMVLIELELEVMML